ncbi:hypothetical protein GCM10009741_01420 [Kribbella lupini]|uniref:Uncharacterized protein n=2 Tax=Kribbella lupini TaxID=291602 RepID=A0ABN2A0D9_9ACTN
MKHGRRWAVGVLVLGLGFITWLLAFGSTHHYRDDSSDRYACTAVLGPVRNGSDYPGYYDSIHDRIDKIDFEDDLRLRDDHAELTAACDRQRQRRIGLSVLLLVPTAMAGSYLLTAAGRRTPVKA